MLRKLSLAAVAAVALTYLLGASAGRGGQSGAVRSATSSMLLAGIAVAAMLTALQTYLQEQHTQILAYVYAWILGGLSAATWSDVWLILPYVAVSAIALLVHRRLLDVLRVGEDEAATLGVNVARLRLAVVVAATLGVAAAASKVASTSTSPSPSRSTTTTTTTIRRRLQPVMSGP